MLTLAGPTDRVAVQITEEEPTRHRGRAGLAMVTRFNLDDFPPATRVRQLRRGVTLQLTLTLTASRLR